MYNYVKQIGFKLIIPNDFMCVKLIMYVFFISIINGPTSTRSAILLAPFTKFY